MISRKGDFVDNYFVLISTIASKLSIIEIFILASEVKYLMILSKHLTAIYNLIVTVFYDFTAANGN